MERNKKRLLEKIVFAAWLALLPAVVSSCAEKKEPEKQRIAPVKTAMAVTRDIPLEINAIGEIEAYSSVKIKSQVGGPVVKVHFSEGQYVKKGDLLFTIDPRPFEVALKQAEATLARDKAQLENAVTDAERYETLVKKGYVAAAQYEQFRTAAEALKATVKADAAAVENAKIQLGYSEIRSPITGRTGSVLFNEGNIVKANDDTELVAIHRIEPIYVSFTVPEQDLGLIKKHMAGGRLRVEASPEGVNPSKGVLTFIDNAVDRQTGTIRLKGTLGNSDSSLWPGQFVNVSLRLTVEKGVLAVPARAVMAGQNGQYVFVIKEDMSAESRPIVVERTYGEDTVVSSGVKKGERVVIDGALQLVPGSKVEIKDGGTAEGGR